MNKLFLLGAAVITLGSAARLPAQTFLIANNSVWRYLDNGSNQGTNWILPGFNDSSWATGPAELGYGDGDETTTLMFGPDSNNKFITTYFRRTFVATNPATFGSLVLNVERDDGVIVYINGLEVHRGHMPLGDVTFTTAALSAIDDTVDNAVIPASVLVTGVNTIAAEIHQANGTSSDISFNLELFANLPPTVSLDSPTGGQTFSGPTNLTLAATATDSDGSISRVEFYAGSTRLGEDTAFPFSLVASNLGEGAYSLTAVAFDNTGGSGTSAPVNVTITDPNPPAIASVTATTNEVAVTFTKRVATPSATNAGNYTINNGVVVNSASYRGTTSNMVVLAVSPLMIGGSYVLTVSNVRDFANNPIALNSQAPFTVGSFSPTDIGGPATAGSAMSAGNGFAATAGGTNIFGIADQFFFNYQEMTGDFDVKVRVESLSLSSAWAKAGLMAREALTSSSRHASTFATPNLNGVFFSHRATAGGATVNAGSLPVAYPNTWLRVRRVGAVFTGYASFDGQNWAQLGTVSMTAPASRFYVGMAVTAASASQTATAQFRDYMDVVGGTIGNLPLPFEPLGPSSRNTGLIISEFMYHPRHSNTLEFIEIYNAQPYPEYLTGWRLTGDIGYSFPAGTVIEPGQFLVVARNPGALQSANPGLANVLGPWVGAETNALSDSAGTIRLRNKANAIVLEVNYRGQNPWPISADGAGHSLALARPSYGQDDYRAWTQSARIGGSPGAAEPFTGEGAGGVVINEFLAHTDPPLVDFIELYNNSLQSINLSGYYLSDDRDTNKFRIPNGTVLPPQGFKVFYETQLLFALSSAGERIYLVHSNQTRVVDSVVFEAQANGVSSGRYPDGAPSFHELASRTPEESNSPLLIRDVVINELMYNPASGDEDDEYVELHNRGAAPVNVGNWRFTDGINYTLPANTMIAPGAYLVVAADVDRLRSYHTHLNTTNSVGNFSGSLANGGERLALAMPDYFTVTNSGVVTTQANYIVVDEVTYDDGGQWGNWSDGGGSSLELTDPQSDNRIAANWADSDETLKAPWLTVENVNGGVDNGNGAFNEVHIMILGRGECLVDDVEVRQGASGPNLVANSTFDAGISGWTFGGNHVASRAEPAGAGNPTPSVRIVASAGGDNGANRIESDCGTPVGTATIRAKFRWLRGHPDVLLRVHGNWIEAPARLTVPNNLGTPGLPNSRRVNNAGPAIYDVTHSPVLPAVGQAVSVTARVSDPDGIGAVNLRYRVDPATTFTIVSMLDNGMSGDAMAGDGLYTGVIPAPPTTNIVAFHVQATDLDAAPVTTVFPPNAAFPPAVPTRECMVRWGETTPFGSFGVYRLWMSQANIARWIARERLSNEALDGTLVYGSWRVIYNAGGRYRGSPFIRPGYSSPLVGNTAFVWTTPEDEPILGADELNLDSLEPTTGSGNQRDATALREPISFWMAGELGLTFSYQRFVHIHINGITSTSRGIPVYGDSQQPDSAYLASWFADDSDGEIWKIDDWFEFSDGDPAREFNIDASLANFTTPRPGGAGTVKDQGRYRWSWEKKFNKGLDDDYSPLFQLVDAVNAPTNNNQVVNAVEAVMDTENWLTAIMLRHAVGDWDGYGYRRGKNQFTYKSAGGKFKMLLWDLDFALGCNSGDGPTTGMFDTGQYNDGLMFRLTGIPHFRRICFRAMQRMVDGPFLAANSTPIITDRYNAFANSAIAATSPFANSGAQNISIPTWIQQRRANLLGSTMLGSVSNATFRVTSSATFTTNGNVVTISGTAPVLVKDILINGQAWPVTWTSVTSWVARVVLSDGANTYRIAGTDINGSVISSTQTVSATYTGSTPSPVGLIVFNELMYIPSVEGASFVEIYNTSTNAYDLGGWRINGLDYAFPYGSLLTNRQYLILAKDRFEYVSAHGTNGTVFDEFDGALDPDGETLTLIKPGANPAFDLVIDKIRYENRQPWVSTIVGTSLQLADNAQDNSRSSAWTIQPGGGPQPPPSPWVKVTKTGNLFSGTNLFFWLTTAGSCYLDDVSLTLTNEGSPNMVVNGDFENGSTDPWILGTNYGTSVVANNVAHSGTRSLLVNGRAPGVATTLGSTVQQWIALNPNYATNNFVTLTYWIAINSNAVIMNMRTVPGGSLVSAGTNFTPVAPPVPVLATPGAPNTPVSTNLPPYDPVWLNELQANNVNGPMDNAGERDPWLELYNSGTNTAVLTGYYLANNYDTNLTQWQFPDGTSIDAGNFLIVWADGQTNQNAGGNLHASFRLNSTTGSVALVRLAYSQPQITDYLTYSGVGSGLSYGDFPDGQPFTRRIFQAATPGSTNISRAINVFINEWMAANTNTIADPADGQFEDWVELFNADPEPVNLGGYYLTDNLDNPRQFPIPNNGQYIIPPGGFLLVWADGETEQNNSERMDLHMASSLSRNGEEIGLFGPDGVTQIDAVTFLTQTDDISEGRFADGAQSIYTMTQPTPRASNRIPGANTSPQLDPIASQVIRLGRTASFMAHATDADLPPQTLIYTLTAGAQTGAQLTPAGAFTWTPMPAQTPSTNAFTVTVTDNGIPQLSASRGFSIIVLPPPMASIIDAGNGNVSIAFDTVPGKTYRVEYKDNLDDMTMWDRLTEDTVAGGTLMNADDSIGSRTQRFYRIVEVP